MSTKLVAAFLDRVQRSGLVSETRLSQLQQELDAAGLNLEDPHAVAAALVDRGVLTQWQTEKLLQGKHKGFFLGSYRLEPDYSWTPAEGAARPDDTGELVRQLLAIGGLGRGQE